MWKNCPEEVRKTLNQLNEIIVDGVCNDTNDFPFESFASSLPTDFPESTTPQAIAVSSDSSPSSTLELTETTFTERTTLLPVTDSSISMTATLQSQSSVDGATISKGTTASNDDIKTDEPPVVFVETMWIVFSVVAVLLFLIVVILYVSSYPRCSKSTKKS